MAFTVLSQTESELFNLRLYFGNLINLEDFVHFVGAFNYFRQIESVGDHLELQSDFFARLFLKLVQLYALF